MKKASLKSRTSVPGPILELRGASGQPPGDQNTFWSQGAQAGLLTGTRHPSALPAKQLPQPQQHTQGRGGRTRTTSRSPRVPRGPHTKGQWADTTSGAQATNKALGPLPKAVKVIHTTSSSIYSHRWGQLADVNFPPCKYRTSE